MLGNFEQERITNPNVPVKQQPIYASLYIKRHGRRELFKRRVQIKRGGFGHHYWYYKGKKLCPVHKESDRWVISTY